MRRVNGVITEDGRSYRLDKRIIYPNTCDNSNLYIEIEINGELSRLFEANSDEAKLAGVMIDGENNGFYMDTVH